MVCTLVDALGDTRLIKEEGPMNRNISLRLGKYLEGRKRDPGNLNTEAYSDCTRGMCIKPELAVGK